jgi:hypothetical protein
VVFTDATPKSGTRWSGLAINGPGSRLNGCVVEFSSGDGIRVDNNVLRIDRCRISDNQGNGVRLVGTSAAGISASAVVGNFRDGVRLELTQPPLASESFVTTSSITGNSGLGVNDVSTADFVTAAERNYWGSDLGPFDGSDDRAAGGLFNPGGGGQRVSDGVDYDPWIRLGPGIEGLLTIVGGNEQSAPVGQTLPQPLEVEVRSVLDSPLQAIDVIFLVVAGDASILEAQPRATGPDGRARATVRLGDLPGEVSVAVTARDVDSPLAVFVADADGPALFRLSAVRAAGWTCPGDCNGDEVVTIEELVRAVRAALDDLPAQNCPALDRDRTATITVDEVIGAVAQAIRGCPE